MSTPLLLGAVAYDPKVVTIWEGFRRWLGRHDVALDYLLYSNYERQVEDLMSGRIDVAWNSPLAWVRARRAAEADGVLVIPLVMRDSDRDLRTAVVVTASSSIQTTDDLRGKTVAVGASDSPQATLIPLSWLRASGLDLDTDLRVMRFEVGLGLHGDHIGGEREAAVALRTGVADAACVTDSNLLLFASEGTLPASSVRVIAETEPYDHCSLTAGPGCDPDSARELAEHLLAMSYADDEARVLLDLEGLIRWLPARVDRYQALERAVDDFGVYDRRGAPGALR